MHEKPKHGWFDFRLRTLLVVVALFVPPLAWAGYTLNWIRQRQAFLRDHGELAYFGPDDSGSFSLRLFGERSYSFIDLQPGTRRSAIDRAKALFPEATGLTKAWERHGQPLP